MDAKTAKLSGEFVDKDVRGAHIATVWGLDWVAEDLTARANRQLGHLHSAALAEDALRSC